MNETQCTSLPTDKDLHVAEDHPGFTVLMSVYGKDRPEWLSLAVQSVFEQTLPPDEVVLTVDGPVPDALENTIRDLSAQHAGQMRVISIPTNVGLGPALREGMKHASFDLLARMDSDDIAVGNRFELQVSFMTAHSEVGVLGGQIVEFNSQTGEEMGKRIVPCNDSDIHAYLRKRCPFNHMTVMFRKSVVEEAGGYHDWPQNEDYDLWIRMAERSAVFANLPEVLVRVRANANLYMRRGGFAYFKSEEGIQRALLQRGLISPLRYAINVVERFVLQVCMSNRMRAFVYRRLARV